MKRISILFALLLFIGTAFSQSVKTNIPIYGIGNFYLGMNHEQVEEVLSSYKTSETSVVSNNNYITSLKKIMMAEMLFDNCSFHYKNGELFWIIFTLNVDENNVDKEMQKLLSILEADYGMQERGLPQKEEDIIFKWTNGNTELDLMRVHSKKLKTCTITLSCENKNIYTEPEKKEVKYNWDQEIYSTKVKSTRSFGVRIGGGVSTLTNFDRSKIFQDYRNVSVKERFAWDLGFSVQIGIKNNFFFMSDFIVGVSGATVNLSEKPTKVEYTNMQICTYLGKKIYLSKKSNFFFAVGLFADVHGGIGSLSSTSTPDYILDNFDLFDLGAALQAGFEYDKFQISINPQFGFLDVTLDKESKVYNRSLKLALTYKFVMI